MAAAGPDPPTSIDLARALAHPLRHRLLLEFHRGTTSPSRAAKRLDAPLNLVSYHTQVLLSRRCIELVDSHRARGAVERFYRATIEPYLEDAEWLALPPALRRAMTQSLLALIWRDLRHAAMAGGFDTAYSHLSRVPLELDDRARDELGGLLRGLIDEVVRIQDESAARSPGSGAPVELVMLHFRRASAPEAWDRRRA
jgi:hypothetical protein